MKAAFVVFNGMTMLDFVGVYDPLTRLRSMGFMPEFSWEVCSFTNTVKDDHGLEIRPSMINEPLDRYDLLVAPGGFSTRELVHDEKFLDWLKSSQKVSLKASVCTGSLLLGAAGFLHGKRATTHHNALADLSRYCEISATDRIVDEGDIITAGGVSSALDLGLYLVDRLKGSAIRDRIAEQMAYFS